MIVRQFALFAASLKHISFIQNLHTKLRWKTENPTEFSHSLSCTIKSMEMLRECTSQRVHGGRGYWYEPRVYSCS